MTVEKVIGIDLGTTNSCVAIVEGGTPTVIPNRGGYKTTPSMVAVTEAGKRLVGHIAKRQAITNAEYTVSAAKRLIGRKWTSPQVKNAVSTSSYKIVEGPHSDVRIALRDKEYSVPEIGAMVLQEMKVIAEDYLGEPVTKAVVTVPARSQASTSSESSTSPRRRRSRTASVATSNRSSRSTTSAAARSTSRSSRSARTVSSRSSRRPATRSSGVRTSTRGSSTGWSRASRRSTRSICGKTAWPCSG